MRSVTGLNIRRLAIRRLLSSTAIVPPVALALTLQMEQPAMAGDCTAGPTSVCSGAASALDTTQSVGDGTSPVIVTTEQGFGLNVTGGGNGISIFGEGGVTFTDNNESTIATNGDYGLYATNATSGDLTITSTGSLISTGANDDGIRTYNYGEDTLIRVHDTEGDGNGIIVDHQGSGSVHIVSTGLATGHGLNGIYGYVWSGTSMTVEAVDTEGAIEGIFAWNEGTGPLVITSTGLASGTTGRGILADNRGGTDVSVSAVDTYGGQIGIRVNNYGSGLLEVTSTGTAEGGVTGLSIYGATSSTSATINAVDTIGGQSGIYAGHNGGGPVTVTSTGTATGGSGNGITVETGTGSSALNINANHVEGGENGIRTLHGSVAGTPGNTATITVTGNIQGGTGFGIATESAAGVLTHINVAAGSVVGSDAGNGISNDNGDSNVDIDALGTVNGRVELGAGSDTITLRGGFSGITVLDGGGGGTDVLDLFDANETRAGSDILNWTEINLDNSYLTLTGGSVAVGTPGDMTTGIFLRNGSTLDGTQDDFSLDGNLALAAGTRFLASGDGSGTNTISGSVANAGLISAEGGGAGDLLTIEGDYAGTGGFLVLETSLGGDASATDRLDVEGNTSGTTTVRVINTNGLGAATNEGIEVITVGGDSNGVFTLQGDYQIDNVPVVVAGAYAYRLLQGNRTGTETDNWYLRSEFLDSVDPIYQSGASAYEVYPQALLGLNTLATLQQRVGNRSWLNDGGRATGADGGALGARPGATVSKTGVWTRIEGAHNSMDADVSTAGSSFDQDIFKAQAGLDGPLFEGAGGTLLGGVTAHYLYGAADTRSIHGDGRISTNGYGLGGTLTWYGHEGFYVDGQAQATWYESDLSTLVDNRRLVRGNDAFGYAFSLESGHRVVVSEGWSVTPQAQLVYSNIDFDGFTDVFDAPVRLDQGESLQGRLGLTIDRETSWHGANGQTNRAHTYGIANLYYEFLDGSRVDVDGTKFDFEKDRVWGGVGAGGSYSWNDDAYSIYAEGLVSTSLADIGDSYSLQGKAGFRMKW